MEKIYFFPKIKSKGFIGLNSIFEINDNFIPSRYEIENKLVPKEICITNPKYYEIFKKKKKISIFQQHLQSEAIICLKKIIF